MMIPSLGWGLSIESQLMMIVVSDFCLTSRVIPRV